jgi:GNAT superfamily N-acetyltransferase
MGEVKAPEPITEAHLIESFSCGVPVLDEWLKRRALIICQDRQVVGYYTLATGSIDHRNAPGKIRRNMPNPIPVIVLGRLAVDQQWQHAGMGRGLLKDALLRSLSVSKQAGIRALLVHTLSEDAKHFYTRNGFLESPLDPMTLMIALQDAAYCL